MTVKADKSTWNSSGKGEVSNIPENGVYGESREPGKKLRLQTAPRSGTQAPLPGSRRRAAPPGPQRRRGLAARLQSAKSSLGIVAVCAQSRRAPGAPARRVWRCKLRALPQHPGTASASPFCSSTCRAFFPSMLQRGSAHEEVSVRTVLRSPPSHLGFPSWRHWLWEEQRLVALAVLQNGQLPRSLPVDSGPLGGETPISSRDRGQHSRSQPKEKVASRERKGSVELRESFKSDRKHPEYGYAVPPPSAQPNYSNTYTIIQQPATTTSVVVVGGCPACRVGVLEDTFTCLGVLCAIVFFPIGILFCLALRQRRCPNCGAAFG
nr:PREDICTED: brain protein I3 [Struthio camelus australis]